MNETSSAIMALQPDLLTNSVEPAIRRCEAWQVDEHGKPVPDGIPGKVLTRSMRNCLGYWRREEATGATGNTDRCFHSVDLAVRRPDGHYRMVGRIELKLPYLRAS